MEEKPSKRPRRTSPARSVNDDGTETADFLTAATTTSTTSTTNSNNKTPTNQELFLDASQTPVIKLFASIEDLKLRQDLGSREITMSSSSHLNYIMTLREILGLDPIWKPFKGSHNPTTIAQGYPGRKSIEWFALSNFLCDFSFLMEEHPELLSVRNKVFFTQSGGGNNPDSWRFLDPSADFCPLNPKEEPSTYGTPTTNPLQYKFDYGSHHTKMFLVGMEDRLRVVVSTANIGKVDLELQANGAFVQDFPFKSSVKAAAAPSSLGDDFEKTLIHYFESYGYRTKKQWSNGGPARTLVDQLAQYDFSNAKAILIPSIPGYHAILPEGEQRPREGRATKPLQGYLKLKNAIQTHANVPSSHSSTRYGPVVSQFSSIGSLSEKWLKDFATSLSVVPPTITNSMGKQQPDLVDMIKLVWPTISEIEGSNQGISGGAAVPGRIKNLTKKCVKPLLCKWTTTKTTLTSTNNSMMIHKPRSIPHIKTFFQLQHQHRMITNADNGSSNNKEKSPSFAWFCMGSQNLSKAAWGEIINGKFGKCHRVVSWEMAVLICPSIMGKRLVPFTGRGEQEGGDMPIPLPYDSIPQRYCSPNDQPWNIDYMA
ncbi:unnamed protein product [Cylindrotheca closterium]|uniref:Phospholipase D/nuclease n=1 Tax=Cylindrotheca closterium TaxID=2856 RepID=A0AAD2FUQ1_9STRA|nr:unnamed protein product [Cylindrotheca closterium]